MRLCSFALLLPLTWPVAHAALPGSEAIVLTGSFLETMPVPALPHAELVQGVIYGEWPGHTVAGGRAVTGVFQTPAAIEFEVAGTSKLAGMRFFLEDAAKPAQTIDLEFARSSHLYWFTRQWLLPDNWRNRQVRLIVEDRDTSVAGRWVAFTLPREAHVFDRRRFTAALSVLASLVCQWGFLLLPGFAVALSFSQDRVLPPPLTITLILLGCGAGAWLCFFSFAIAFPLGRFVSFGVPVAGAVVAALYRNRFGLVLQRQVVGVLTLWLLCAALYTSAGLLYPTGSGPAEQAQDRFFAGQMPPDNVLPLLLGEKMYQHQPFRPAFFLDIQSSDRPPLQTGFMLLQRPFWLFPDMQYLLMGILLQTSWIPALWVLLRRMNVAGRPLLTAIAVPALSQFAFVHDVFVWPKLLSATFGLLALSCFGWVTNRESTFRGALLGGALTALAMLSHGGVMMTVVAFAILMAVVGRPPLRWSAALIGVAAATYLPWVLYQKLFDPPGDALLKLHLAGVSDRNHNLIPLILSSYEKLGFSGWLITKWTNLEVLFWDTKGTNLSHGAGQTAFWLSELKFYHLFPALGFANAGFVLRFAGGGQDRKVPDRLLLIAFASLAIWLLLMFAPESTTIHQGSFVMVLLLFSALALYTAGYSSRAAALLVLLELIEFVLFVVLARPLMDWQPTTIRDTFPDVGMFALFASTLTALGGWFWREWDLGGPLSNEAALYPTK